MGWVQRLLLSREKSGVHFFEKVTKICCPRKECSHTRTGQHLDSWVSLIGRYILASFFPPCFFAFKTKFLTPPINNQCWVSDNFS